jgi:hypothetical protein
MTTGIISDAGSKVKKRIEVETGAPGITHSVLAWKPRAGRDDRPSPSLCYSGNT